MIWVVVIGWAIGVGLLVWARMVQEEEEEKWRR